mgnify:CR=1 FL=1
MTLKQPKTLSQVRKELAKIYWIVCRHPEALQMGKAAVNALGRMVDSGLLSVAYHKFTGRPLSKAHRKFLEG